MKRSLFIIAAFCLLITYGYSQFPKYLYGIVSWYGDEFEGRKTASGEMYNPEDLTAAHRTLPFGTELDIENLENGRKIRVRINDRGPFVESRILDISKKAAENLDILKKGTVYAKVTLVKLGDNKVKETQVQPETNNVLPAAAKPDSTSNTNAAQVQLNSQAVNSPVKIQPALPPAAIPAVTAAPPSVSVSENKPETNKAVPKEIISTNILEVYVTNSVTLTNMIPVPVTNIVTIPPYEEKILEKNLPDGDKANFKNEKLKGDEDFILDEPTDITSLNALPSAEIPPLVVSNNKPVKKDNFNETEVTPDVLLSNETLISPDEKSIKGETFINTNLNNASGKTGSHYVIQAGAFTAEESALRLYDKLKKKGYTVFMSEASEKGKRWLKVKIGYYDTKTKAKEAVEKLKKMKINGLIVESK